MMNDLVNLITSNIWLIVLLVVMFIRRPYRILGMIILASKAAFSVAPSWLIIILCIIGALVDIEQYSHDYATRNTRGKAAAKN